MHASADGGRRWQAAQLNLPPVAVVDLEARHGDLVLGTRGRGLYVFHDLSPLRAALREAPAAAALYAAPVAVRWRSEDRWGQETSADNPPYGALLSYYLPAKVEQEIKLSILDASGRVVRTLSSVAKPADGPLDDPDEPREAPKPELSGEAGWHRVAWDLAHDGGTPLKGAKQIWGDVDGGPLAVPGQYRAELAGPAFKLATELRLDPDPRAPVDAAAMQAQLDFALSLRDSLESTRTGVEWVRSAQRQARHLRRQLDGAAHAAIISAADAVIADARRIEGELHNPEAKVAYDFLRGPKGAQLYSQLVALYNWAQSSDHAPTAAMRTRAAELASDLAARVKAIQAMREGSVAALERAVSEARLPRLVLPDMAP